MEEEVNRYLSEQIESIKGEYKTKLYNKLNSELRVFILGETKV